MADEKKTFLLRVDPLLWKEMEKWASDELRSVNGQIEFLLREALRRRKVSEAPKEASEGPGGPPGGA